MKVLNLYAGIGGNRRLWEDVEVTAVENNPKIAEVYQKLYPNDTVVVTDAHQYLLDHFQSFDFIWSSPPCQTHTKINVNFNYIRYPDLKLYEEIILLKTWFEGKYCIENVIPYYEPLIRGTRYNRHYYWTNFPIKEQKGNGQFESIIINHKRNHDGSPKQKKLTLKEKARKKGFDISMIEGVDKHQVINNAVTPADGLYILNAARNIITKTNTKQKELFE